jgi:protein-tyrosine phosphatase
MRTEFHWVDGPWPGRLAVAARPRGDDWLANEIAGWRRTGFDTVLSLLTSEEEEELGLQYESSEVKSQGMNFIPLPIPDRSVPSSESELTAALEKLDADLASGKNAIVHCRQGIGRSGLAAACLLVTRGLSPDAAMNRVSAARGVTIPETAEQRSWINHYAAILAGAK